MAKTKSGTANLFASMQKVIDKDELSQKNSEKEITTQDKKKEIASETEPATSSKETPNSEIKEKNTNKINANEANKKTENITIKEPQKVKSKMGRPVIREGEYVRFAIDLPIELANQVNIAKLAYNNSIRTYVTKLIQKDLEANSEIYTKFAEMTQEMLNN